MTIKVSSVSPAVVREFHDEMDITDIEIKHIAYVSIPEGGLPDLPIVYLCGTATNSVKVSFKQQVYIRAEEEKCRELLPKAIISNFEKNHLFDILHKP